MDAMDAILSRRSICKYTREPISEKVVKEILEAAICTCVSMCH
jgi:nitroreductase